MFILATQMVILSFFSPKDFGYSKHIESADSNLWFCSSNILPDKIFFQLLETYSSRSSTTRSHLFQTILAGSLESSINQWVWCMNFLNSRWSFSHDWDEKFFHLLHCLIWNCVNVWPLRLFHLLTYGLSSSFFRGIESKFTLSLSAFQNTLCNDALILNFW